MYEFHFDCIKNKYGNNSRRLFTATDKLVYKIKTEDDYEELFNFSNYSAKLECYDDSNKLMVGKMKDEADGVAIKKFFGLNQKMFSFSLDASRDHKKAKGVNKNVVATISHNIYKDVLLNNKCLRHSVVRI